MTLTTQSAVDEAGRKARLVQYLDGAPLRHNQVAKQAKLQRCYEILCAAADSGKICPNNQDLCDMLGYSSPNKASGAVGLLETMGFITVQRGRTNRVVTIVKTGARTAGVAVMHKPGDWTDDQDEILMDGTAEGVGFTEIGKMIGKSKHACISRFKKIAASMGAQAV